MIVLRQFDRGIGEVAAPVVGRHAFLGADQPGLQLRLHVAGMIALKIPPHLVDLDGDAAQIGDDEVVLRIEVSVQGHLVGAGGLGDGFDAHAANAVPME